MSMSTTSRASSFSARRCAAVAPTFPAPTTVILSIPAIQKFRVLIQIEQTGLRSEKLDRRIRDVNQIRAGLELPKRLVKRDADRRGKIQASGGRSHRNSQAVLGRGVADIGGQSA